MKKLLILLLIVSVTKSVKAQAPAAMPASYSYFIPLDSANKMIQSYLYSVAGTDSNLYSIIFNADSLRHLLSNPNIKNVKISLAHTLPYINNGNKGRNCGYKTGQLTFILSGYDSDKNYIYTGNKVLNGGLPCPTSCPGSGTAAQNIFPIP